MILYTVLQFHYYDACTYLKDDMIWCTCRIGGITEFLTNSFSISLCQVCLKIFVHSNTSLLERIICGIVEKSIFYFFYQTIWEICTPFYSIKLLIFLRANDKTVVHKLNFFFECLVFAAYRFIRLNLIKSSCYAWNSKERLSMDCLLRLLFLRSYFMLCFIHLFHLIQEKECLVDFLDYSLPVLHGFVSYD